MSRIGKRHITIPPKTEVTFRGGVVSVKGPGGELHLPIRPEIAASVVEDAIILTKTRESKLARMLWGTYGSRIAAMIEGVHKPFVKKLMLEGIGYRVELSGNALKFALGFSHPVLLSIPEELKVVIEKNIITVSGINKEIVGQFAATIRAQKKPEPYKGKGIRYEGEIIRIKQGKKAVA